MGSQVEGPQRVVRRDKAFGIQAGLTPGGKRFFPTESGAGPEGARRASELSWAKAASVGFHSTLAAVRPESRHAR